MDSLTDSRPRVAPRMTGRLRVHFRRAVSTAHTGPLRPAEEVLDASYAGPIAARPRSALVHPGQPRTSGGEGRRRGRRSPHADAVARRPWPPYARRRAAAGPLRAPGRALLRLPNRSKAEQLAIRNRVLNTIQSVWGGPRDPHRHPEPGNGKIRIATWSFDDWAVARALVAARNRGVSVQVVAAKTANGDHGPWKLAAQAARPEALPARAPEHARHLQLRPAVPGLLPRARRHRAREVLPLRQRRAAATPRYITLNTSMNLTRFGLPRPVEPGPGDATPAAVYNDFLNVFRQARLGRPVPPARTTCAHDRHARHRLLLPAPGRRAGQRPGDADPRTGSTAAGPGTAARARRTRIRIIQYAIYGDRGDWIAKRLRYLWNRGCDVGIIYSISSRPVLEHPAQRLRPRPGPDAPVGDQERLRATS